MLPNEYKPRQTRPMSEIINPGHFMNEADITGQWYEDLQNYESNLDEMASTSLDQNFKDELHHVDQWYRYLNEAEKTATIYTLLQQSTQVQARFFINLLQQMCKKDTLYSLLAPSNPDQDMQSRLAKAELDASQRLISVLPYKTGQVMSRPQSNTNRRTVDRHSFALGDTEEYSQLFGRGAGNNFMNSNSNRNSYAGSLLDDPSSVTISSGASVNNNNGNNNAANSSNNRKLADGGRTSGTSGRAMFNNNNRPHSVIEGNAASLFSMPTTANWLSSVANTTQLSTTNTTTTVTPTNSISSTSRRQQQLPVGHIGDRKMPERPKSADISSWSLPMDDIVDRRSSGIISNSSGNNRFVESTWNTANAQQSITDPADFTNALGQMQLQQQHQTFRRRPANMNRIPVVPEDSDLFLNDDSRLNPPFLNSSSSSIQGPSLPHVMDHYSNFLMNGNDSNGRNGNINLSMNDASSSLQSKSIVDNGEPVAEALFEEYGYASDHSDGSHMSRPRSSMNPNSRATKDKKAIEVVDMDLLKDVSAWLRSLRLHKYNTIFSDTDWKTIVKMSDEDLLAKGVSALGARRKMLKVFENVRAHCDANNIEY